jgi:uncharacterized protein (DUF736 family)
MADVDLMLFQTKHKTKPTSPDWHGRATIELQDGHTYDITVAGWNKRSERAGEFISLSIAVGNEPLTDAMNSQKESRR